MYFCSCWDVFANDKDKEEYTKELSKVPENSLGHAGSDEGSEILIVRPDLMRLNNFKEDGQNKARISNLKNVSTGVDWYASFPNQYAGDANFSNESLGNIMKKVTVNALVEIFRCVKQDKNVPTLMNQFYID